MKQLLNLIALISFSLLVSKSIRAQNESAIWYFGNNAGIDFNYSPPKAIKNPSMITYEGCSSISDSIGKILFYTDGQTAWNKYDTVMPNGFGLKGNASSTHSSVVVKKPFSPNEYYIISADAGLSIGGPSAGNEGIRYSLLDLSDGKGVVVSKNNLLVDQSAEKIAVATHRNGVYSWLAIPKGKSKAIYMYLVTENGIELKHIDSTLLTSNVIHYGQIKFSPNSKLLAFVSQSNQVNVFDFNNLTGRLQNKQVITNTDDVYGLEFSPSGKYLYLSTWFTSNKLCQCDVKNGTTAYATDCKFYTTQKVSGQLQLGPDQKIYVANNSQRYLGVISKPDTTFALSSYTDSAITLLPGTMCYLGLPTFHTGYLNVEQIMAKDICLKDTAYYSMNASKLIYDSLSWFINGQPTGNTSSSGKHLFNQDGMYTISLVVYQDTIADTFSRTISVKPLPLSPQLSDTVMCKGDSITLNAYKQPEITYLWSNTQTDSVIHTSIPGTYSVTLTKEGCSITNQFKLTEQPFPIINIPNQTVICENTSTTISAYTNGCSYLWSTNDTDSAITVNQAQQYWVSVTQNGCTTTDTFQIITTTIPQPDLGPDTVLCNDAVYHLQTLTPFSTYLWNTGTTDTRITVVDTGWYYVNVSNPCGIVSDSVLISRKACHCTVWTPNAFSPNNDNVNDYFSPLPSCEYDYFELKIYNRWGQEVFATTNPDLQWDGQLEGYPSPADVYVWHINCQLRYPGVGPQVQNLSGTVTLLR